MQRQHYRSGMPEVFRQLQELDEKRIKNIRNFIHSSVDIERNVFPIINTCLDGIIRAGNLINEKEDMLMVVEKYKSGFQPPEDFPFDDLSKTGSDSGASLPTINSIHETKSRSLTVKGTISGKGIKKRTGIFNIFGSRGYAAVTDGKDDFSDLAPNQRIKKLRQRVEELQAKVKNESAARDGLMKMKGVYEGNPQLGDPMTIEGQLNECSHKLDKLQSELRRYQGYLEEATRAVQNNSLTNSPQLENGARNYRNSGGGGGGGSGAEEESLSSCSNSPESGLGTSHTSLPGADSDQDQYDGNDRDYYDNISELDMLQPLGTCKAIYPFDATSEGSIPMAENEELHLIETDQGDGWTRVRRMNGSQEGFVPTSYIDITLFNT